MQDTVLKRTQRIIRHGFCLLELTVSLRIGKEKHASCLSSSGLYPVGKLFKHAGATVRAEL